LYRGLDARGEVDQVSVTFSCDYVSLNFAGSLDYVYDSAGRRTAMSTLEGTWTSAYDPIGQLIEELGLSHEVMKSIKKALDPKNILNPGKMGLTTLQKISMTISPIGNLWRVRNGSRVSASQSTMRSLPVSIAVSAGQDVRFTPGLDWSPENARGRVLQAV
jgi:hypothetical protein